MNAKSARYPDLALKKRLLRTQSALLRHQLSADWQQTVAPVRRVADRASQGAHWLRAHPAWVAGAGAALLAWLAWRPAPSALPALPGLLSLARRGMGLWRIWQRVQPVLARLGLQAAAPERQAPPSAKSATLDPP